MLIDKSMYFIMINIMRPFSINQCATTSDKIASATMSGAEESHMKGKTHQGRRCSSSGVTGEPA